MFCFGKGRCSAAAASITSLLKSVNKDCDIEEFVHTIELVSSGVERASQQFRSSPSLVTQLTQFAVQLEAYHKNLQHHGKKLADVLMSARRRPALAQHSSRIYTELKFILEAAIPSSMQDLASPDRGVSLRKRSLGQLTSQEAQAFWKTHFLDLELEMVPWDRFIANFSVATNQKLELADEILLKHVLDNDTLGAVTPKELNSLYASLRAILFDHVTDLHLFQA